MSTVRNISSRGRWLAGLAALVAILAAVGVALSDRDGGGGSDGAQGTSSAATTARTTAPTAAGTRAEPTTAGVRSPVATDPTGSPEVDTSTVVWPWKTSAVRYDDPRSAARGFATDFAGFSAPVVGPFLQGDSRSGEVAVRPRRDGPVSTVLVRQLEDQHWWVIGSVTDALQLDVPSTGDRIHSPLRLTGRADAYEGHVDVGIRQ